MQDQTFFPFCVKESLYLRGLFQVINEGHLAAIGEFGATVTLSPDLTWYLHLVYLRKAKPLKKARPIGQAKYGGNTQLPSVIKAGFYYLRANPSLLAILGDGQRFYLG